MPVALIGLIGYVAILGSLLAPEGELARFATMALTLGGFGFSAYLTYREVFTLHKICEWCVSSAVDHDRPDVPVDLALPARRCPPTGGSPARTGSGRRPRPRGEAPGERRLDHRPQREYRRPASESGAPRQDG